MYSAYQMSEWRHDVEIISVLLALCAGESPLKSEAVIQIFNDFFVVRLKQAF